MLEILKNQYRPQKDGVIMLKKYRTGELLDYLGITRDTLRYYEKKGLLSPQKNNENNYRDYDFFDIYKIMIIDFYKKRGMSIQQIHSILENSDSTNMQTILQNKKNELEKVIYEQQCMLKRIDETQCFYRNLINNLNIFTVKPMPLFKVCGEVSDFTEVAEYENVLGVTQKDNDMLSQIMRYIKFDHNGVKNTKMLIVEAIDKKIEEGEYLQHSKCLYTIAEEIQPSEEMNKSSEQSEIMQKMHTDSYLYAKEHGLKLKGEAFASIRFIMHQAPKFHTYIEIYVPFE